jgi:murein DD-endopeptidase MepM/ murein hydrolase activator NlpD
MRTRFNPLEQRSLLKFVSAALLAGACAACSDSGRFGDNAFTNPFSTAAAPAAPKVDRTTTASIPARMAPTSPVTSQPLPPPMPRASVTNPITSTPLPSTSSVMPQPTPRVASAALQKASPVGGAATGWTATGGTPVTTGAGDTADALSARYGVPASAILAANGGQVRPGQQVIIPVYNGSSAAPKAAAPVAPAVQRATPITNPITRPAQPTPTVTAQQQRPVVMAAPKPAKPEANDDDDEDDKPAGRIVAAAPKASAPALAPARPVAQAQQPRAVTAQQAKPVRPAAPAPSTRDDDDEEEDDKPQKQAAKPAAPVAQARPQAQPRVIPMTPERPQVAEAPKQPEPQTTNSIPPARAQQQAAAPAPAQTEAAGDKPEFRWPARGRVISGFGARGGNGDGIAIAVPEGTPVKAAEGGTVAYSGEELKGYGKMVLIRHDNGYVSAYAHNGELNVKRGDRVSRGQVVAKSGATGNVTSPQLHFELRRGSTPVDPTKYLDN